MLMRLIYGVLQKMVGYKLMIKYVERRKVVETIRISGGGIKR